MPDMRTGGRVLVCLGIALAVVTARSEAQTGDMTGVPSTTEERLQSPGWWPTKHLPQREEYLGPAACAVCHASEAADQKSTPMAKACAPAGSSKHLQAHPRLTFRQGPYTYVLKRTQTGDIFSVTKGEQSISVALAWVLGEGEVGETPVFERDGIYYEGRLSYFPALGALDISPGHPHSVPDDLAAALGFQLTAQDAKFCFGCHNTAAATGGQFHPDRLIPGVTCEACHGPGAKHVAAMKAGQHAQGLDAVLNPAKLGPVDSVDYCGACHRTWSDVLESGATGVRTVRFQPYRLESSRCWGAGDARLTCLACHDPHEPLVRASSAYDAACLRCHSGVGRTEATENSRAIVCPRGTKDCVACHMPKYEAPDTHTEFTDHRIRVVSPDRSYPD
jgi:hypothetical protein